MTTDPTLPSEDRPTEATKPETPAEPDVGAEDAASAAKTPRILIGSQRDVGAVRPVKHRDWYVPGQEEASSSETTSSTAQPPKAPVERPAAKADAAPVAEPPVAPPEAEPPMDESAVERKHFPPPNIRDKLPPELEDELEASLADVPLDHWLTGSDSVTSGATLDTESKYTGRVVALRREDVFVELGSREQGIVPMRQFAEPPEVGAELTVAVVRFNADEGLYELRLPGTAASVGDWSDLDEGTLVDAMITGHNAGGLECEVNHIRGFIPVSQISLYRVEDLSEFVGQKMTCLVTEANPERRNLVLSRRALLEREREEAREQMLASLAPGQVHEGVVRKLMDFGAFVDLGGVDGLLHVSELAWGRVHHPKDVLEEGQRIKVRILKVNPETHRISLGYRDMLQNPWDDVERKFPVNTVVQGTVVKIMDFGAFVELEPGIEGLVHISELDHKRVWRPSDVVSEGQTVEVLVKSIDKAAQRISLSIKDAKAPAEPVEKKDEPTDEQLAAAMPKSTPRRSNKPLKGGLGRVKGGGGFGLNW